MTTTGWPGKRSKNAATCSGLRRLLERQHRPAVAHRRVQRRRRADLLERVRVGREVGMLCEQLAQLVLERVVVGVGDVRLAAVVGVAQRRSMPRGELLDARAGSVLVLIPRTLRAVGDEALGAAGCGPLVVELEPDARVVFPRA